jgi:hypothetical protein
VSFTHNTNEGENMKNRLPKFGRITAALVASLTLLTSSMTIAGAKSVPPESVDTQALVA